MALVPRTNSEKVAYFEAHNAPWSTNATAIGTTTAAVTDLATKVTAVKTALAAQVAAQIAAKNATAAVNQAVEAMDNAGAAIIGSVKMKAKTAGDGVYLLAQIPAPATPQPSPPPGQPTDFKATLNANGSLSMTWKCPNSGLAGVVYMIYRKTGAVGDFISVGGTGERKFTDPTIPAGTTQVTYSIQAIRSTAAGPFAEFVVNFGANGLLNPQAVPVKLAA